MFEKEAKEWFENLKQAKVPYTYDGCGNLLFINKETFQFEEGESCFKDGLEIWKIAENENHYGLPDETTKRIISHFREVILVTIKDS